MKDKVLCTPPLYIFPQLDIKLLQQIENFIAIAQSAAIDYLK